MNMLIWGIQVAGLNRAKIRDVLAYRTQPWPGVTGDIPLSSCLDDAGEVFLTKVRRRQVEVLFAGRPRPAQTAADGAGTAGRRPIASDFRFQISFRS